MKIERHIACLVIRKGKQYFQCFDGDAALWISTPHLARWFTFKDQAQEVLAEIRRRSAGERQVKADMKQVLAAHGRKVVRDAKALKFR